MTEEKFAALLGDTEHEAGCVYGGFSCGYWLISDECDLEHWEKHIVLADGRCPCGSECPGAFSTVVFLNASEDE
jgi:hypothetical protein